MIAPVTVMFPVPDSKLKSFVPPAIVPVINTLPIPPAPVVIADVAESTVTAPVNVTLSKSDVKFAPSKIVVAVISNVPSVIKFALISAVAVLMSNAPVISIIPPNVVVPVPATPTA